MEIIFDKKFDKKFNKLRRWEKAKTKETIKIFQQNPFDPRLRNHALRGKLSGLRSVSVSFDLRIIFIEKDNYLKVLFLALGSHEEVY